MGAAAAYTGMKTRFLPLRGTLAALLIAGLLAPAAAATTAPKKLKPAVLTVHIKDYKYKPASATIHLGDTVTFINDDDDAHTVRAAKGDFDSGGLDTHDTWQYTFKTPGKHDYFCALHPNMKGTLFVVPPAK